MEGWIKLHRKLREWEWYDDPITKAVFLELLLTVNHKEKKWHGVTILPGQRVASYGTIASGSGVTYNQARRALNTLKRTGEITVKSTSKYSIITLIKWGKYQIIEDDATDKSTGKRTVNAQANHRQTTTNKNDKNVENDKKNNLATQNSVADDMGKAINSLFEVFQQVNPTINYGNTTQRKAAERVIEKLGVDKATKAAKYAVAILGTEYAPSITNPLELSNGLAKLFAHKKRDDSKSKQVTVIS